MRKTIQTWMIAMLVALVAAACGAPAKDGTNGSNAGSVKQEGGQSNSGNDDKEEPNATEEPTPAPTPEYPSSFDIGDVLVFPNQYEIRMVSQQTATKVVPPNPDDYYTYYEVKEPDKIYVHTVFKVKNLSGDSVAADEVMDVKVMYDGKYEYSAFSTIEEKGGGDFTYTNITGIAPLTEGVLHFLAEVPLEVKDSGKPVEVIVSANGLEITGTGNESEGQRLVMGEEIELQEKTAWKQYAPLAASEPVTEEDYAELTVLDAEFATKVVPPKASGYYSYYEVKEPAHTYAHVSFAYKNLATAGKVADEAINVRLIYDNKYEYRGFSAIEENNGADFTYSNITNIDPLTTGRIHYLIEVPAEVETSGRPVVLVVQMNETNYYYEMKQ